MQLQLSIKVDEFVWTALEERSNAERVDVGQLVSQASVYYASELESGRAASTVPRFAREIRGGESRTLTLELDAASLARIQQEAERQEMPLERLMAHAAILYLADEDAGRIAERVARRAAAEDTQPG